MQILHWEVEAEFPNQMLCWELKWLKDGVMLLNKGSLVWEAANDYFSDEFLSCFSGMCFCMIY